MKRTKEEAQQTREKIFDAGLKVFSLKGYSGATLNDVAREAGITRGAIYWHYKNKEAFFREVEARLETYYDDVIEKISRSEVWFPNKLRTIIIELLNRFNEDLQWRRMQEFALRSFLSHKRLNPSLMQRTIRDKPMDLLKRAIERREIYHRWDETSALLALASFISGMFLHIIQTNITLTEKQIAELADFVVRGFTVQQGEER